MPLPLSGFKWRKPYTAVRTAEPEELVQLAFEHNLRVIETMQGYRYIAVQNEDGYDLIRSPPFERNFYNARRVATQANAGGGAVIVDISPPTGQAYILQAVRGANSGTNGLVCVLADEDFATILTLAEIGSAAGVKFNLPSPGASASSTGNIANSYGLIISKGQYLRIYQTGAGAQNDTLTVSLYLEPLNPGASTTPTYSVAASTNAGDVTLAASSITDGNTLTTTVVQR